jgi:2,3-bisphosphoglycerate-independent phosphoglycerate mutase
VSPAIHSRPSLVKRPSSQPVVLIVRDGWGANPHAEWNHANAVHLARKPVDDWLMRTYPHGLIKTSGNDVGLPDSVSGNSEVGHQNIGAGRIVEQEIMRITGRIRDGSFFANPVLIGAFQRARQTGGRVHIMGLCSDGRVHSDLDHLFGLLELSRRLDFPGSRVFVHAFTDGRDAPPFGGAAYLEQVEQRCRSLGINPVASVIGRYYSMDRDHRWDRIERAYRMLVHGEGARFASAAEALQDYYRRPHAPDQQGDEFVTPRVVVRADSPTTIADGDGVIFFNYRGDRPRQLTKAFVYDEFPYLATGQTTGLQGFDRGRKLDLYFATMTAYEENLPVQVAFAKPPRMTDILGAYLAGQGLRQFRCAETEKYAHVTYFFNGGREVPFEGEDRVLVPSPKVATYDLQPEMSARGITEKVVEAVKSGQYTFVLVNFANPDMVGHTGFLDKAIIAAETVDDCVRQVVEATVNMGGAALVTADHGNSDQMLDYDTGKPHTAHTTNLVPFIYVAQQKPAWRFANGLLGNVAPTVLELLELELPPEMTCKSLIRK